MNNKSAFVRMFVWIGLCGTICLLGCVTTQSVRSGIDHPPASAGRAPSNRPPTANTAVEPEIPVPLPVPPAVAVPTGTANSGIGERMYPIRAQNVAAAEWWYRQSGFTWRVCEGLKALFAQNGGTESLVKEERAYLQDLSESSCYIQRLVERTEGKRKPYLLKQVTTLPPAKLKEVALCQSYQGAVAEEAAKQLIGWIETSKDSYALQKLQTTVPKRCLGTYKNYTVSYESWGIAERLLLRIQTLQAGRKSSRKGHT